MMVSGYGKTAHSYHLLFARSKTGSTLKRLASFHVVRWREVYVSGLMLSERNIQTGNMLEPPTPHGYRHVGLGGREEPLFLEPSTELSKSCTGIRVGLTHVFP